MGKVGPEADHSTHGNSMGSLRNKQESSEYVGYLVESKRVLRWFLISL
jgi:hypothetical protein